MTRALALISLVTLAAAAAACSNSHSMPDDGGPGGDAEPPRDGDMPPPDDGGTDDAEPPPPPPECAVETDREGPFETTFRFANDTDEELWVLRTCRLQMTLQSCASDYGDVSMWGDCTIDCAEAEGGGGCIACGACMYQPVQVTPGGPAEITWPGNTYTFDETAAGCSCHVKTPAQAGKYRATIRVYASEEATMSGDVLRVVEHDFELPAPDGVVTVPLGE